MQRPRARAIGRVGMIGLSLASVLTPAAGALAQARARLHRIDSLVEAYRAETHAPGVSIAVVRGTDTAALKGYGLANVELDVPATPRTVYQIASISKQFTGAAILQLVDAGKVALDDEITKYFPDYVVNGRRVTIYHLLAHTHGMQEYNRPETRADWVKPLGHQKFLDLMKDQPFDFPVGSRFLYRNTGYYFAAMIVEQMGGGRDASGGGGGPAGGKLYADYLHERIFLPNGMTDSRDCVDRPIVKNRAQGYSYESGRLLNRVSIDMSWPFGVGSLCSTVIDLVKWNAALHGGKVVSATSYQRMITPATLTDGSRTEYGLGLRVASEAGRRIIEHSGGTIGYTSHLVYFPDEQLSVAVLTNLESGGPRRLAHAIAKAVLEGSP